MANTMLTSFRGYVFASFLLTTAVVGHAVYMKRFFYRAVIFLANSKLAILAVGNMVLVSVLLVWRLIQAIFLGPLRFREVERLHYRARDAIIECCFAMSIFRNEFDLKFVALVMTLLLLKSLHWLVKDRIEFLEEQPLSPVRTHLRLVGLMTLLLVLDSIFVERFASVTMSATGATMYILFAFEFTISIIELVSDIVRYCFLVIDNSMEGHWEGKAMCSFYVELLSDLCQLTVYILFYAYVQYHYTFPFHIVREVYVTFTRFQRRCSDFWRFRRVVATMNDLFADATEEELADGDRTCIICREEMETAKKLDCGHLFHARCLQNWLKRQQSCPTCRATIDIAGTRAESRNAQPRNAGANNPMQPNQQNINNNNFNNGNAAPQANNQAAANIGEAGMRLLNLANQWWNQVLVEAGAARGVGGGAAGAAAGAGRPGGAQGVGNIPGAPGANPPVGGAQQQDATRRQVPPQNNLMGGNVFLRGPNAVAHMQLRARRRVAWPHPYQPYQMQPHLQHLHQYPNMNPYQQPQFQPPAPANQGNQGNPAGSPGNPMPMSHNPGLQAEQGGGSSEPVESAAVPGSSSSAASGYTASASNGTDTLAPLSLAENGQGRRPAESSTVPGQSSGIQSASGSQTPRLPERRDPGPSVQPTRSMPQVIPLDKLLSIQERIEVLRNEVMELVLLATSAPPNTNSEEGNDDNVNEPATQAGEAEMDVESLRNQENVNITAEEPGAPAVAEAARRDADEEEDSEAATLRRRRIEFLERVSGS